MRPLVIIESPYKANERFTVEEHLVYARRALLDSLFRGEAPLASHLLYTQVLDDNDPKDRQDGIEAGLAWYAARPKICFYVDLGWSAGMLAAEQVQIRNYLPYEVRRIGP